VNVGPTGGKLGSMQLKSDGLAIGGLFQTYSDTYLATGLNSKVGIGTTHPTSALDVRGGMNVDGKITVSTGASVSYVPALWGVSKDGHLTVCDLPTPTGKNCKKKDSVGGTGNSVVFGASLWVGGWSLSNAGNLYKCDNEGKCQNTGNKTSGRKILAMASFGDSLWLGDSSGYLYKCDTAGTCSNEGDKGGSITAMTADANNLWIGHDGGSVKKCDDTGSCVQAFAFGNVSALALNGNTLFVGINGDVAKVRPCDITTKVCGSIDYGSAHITAMVSNYYGGVGVATYTDPTYQYWDPNYPSFGGDYSGGDNSFALVLPNGSLEYVGSGKNITRSIVLSPDYTTFLGVTDKSYNAPQLFSCQGEGGCSQIGLEGPPVYGLNIFGKAVHAPVKSVTMSNGALDIMGDLGTGNGNIIMGGANSWILHTPDDGRTDFFIAPKTNGTWDWAHEVRIQNNGTMNVSGNMNVGGSVNVGGLPVAGNDVLSRETRTFIGGLNIPIPYVNNYSGWKLMKSWNFAIRTISTKTISLNFLSKNTCNNGEIIYKLQIVNGAENTVKLACNNNNWNSGTFNLKVDPGTLYTGAKLYVNGSNVNGGKFDFTKPWTMYLYKGYSF